MAGKDVLILILILCSIWIPLVAQERGSLWQTHTNAGQDAMSKRQYEGARIHFEQALKEAEYFGAQDDRLVLSIDNLARSRHFEKKYVEAEVLYLRALGLQEARYGLEHESIATRLIDLAGFYYSQPERKAEAEPLMIRAVKIQEKSFGPDSPQLSFTLITWCLNHTPHY